MYVKLKKFNNLPVMIYKEENKRFRVEYLPNQYNDKDILDEIKKILLK